MSIPFYTPYPQDHDILFVSNLKVFHFNKYQDEIVYSLYSLSPIEI